MSKLPLIGVHRRPSVGSPSTSFLDMKFPPLPREQAEEEAMALLYLYDREAWAYLTGFTVDKALNMTTQESTVCQ